MASWQDTGWDDFRITEDDFSGGALVRLSFPDGTVIFGKPTMKPFQQNEKALMGRFQTKYSGDIYINVAEAIVAVFDGDKELS